MKYVDNIRYVDMVEVCGLLNAIVYIVSHLDLMLFIQMDCRILSCTRVNQTILIE